MRKTATCAGVCVCLFFVWAAAAQEDEGAKVEQFKIKLSDLKHQVKEMSRSGEELNGLKETIYDETDTEKQMELVTRYLDKRLDAVKVGRAVLQGLDEAITSGKNLKMLPDRPDVARVLNTYTEEFKGVLEDMKLLSMEANELFPEENAEGNPLLKAGEEIQAVFSEVIKEMNVTGWLTDEGKVDTKEFFENLKKMRYAVALHLQTSKFDYRINEQYLKSAELKQRYADLLKGAFEGMDMGDYLMDGVMNADELQAWTFQLGNMLDQIKLPSLDLLKNNAKRQQFMAALKERPKNQKVGETWYFYHRGKDRYYHFKKGTPGRIWAPFDYTKNTGRYVQYNGEDQKWYSHDPSYEDGPVEIFPDEEIQSE